MFYLPVFQRVTSNNKGVYIIAVLYYVIYIILHYIIAVFLFLKEMYVGSSIHAINLSNHSSNPERKWKALLEIRMSIITGEKKKKKRIYAHLQLDFHVS